MLEALSKSSLRVVCRTTLTLCALFFLLPACSVVRPLDPSEQEAVRQSKKAVALFRLTGSLDKKKVHLLLDTAIALDQFNYTILSFGLANMDVSEPMKRLLVSSQMAPWVRPYPYFSPTPELAEDGWGAFLLEPGTYYLRIISEPAGILDPIPEFRFRVPPNSPLVYIGSLDVDCTTYEKAGWFGGREFAYGSCSAGATAANEEGAAKQVAQAGFDFGTVSTMIMQRFDHTPLPRGTIAAAASLGILAPRSKIEFGSPEWMKRAISRPLAFFDHPENPILVGVLRGVAEGTVASGAGILLAPPILLFGHLRGKLTESAWEPCRQALQDSLSKFDPMSVLAAKLKTALTQWGVNYLEIAPDSSTEADTTRVKNMLNVQIQRVVLRLCPPSSVATPPLCLETATRARLFESATETYYYDRLFVYSDAELSTVELQPYESSVSWSKKPATPRTLEAYCEAGGAELLQGDISNALDATVHQIVQDLGLRIE